MKKIICLLLLLSVVCVGSARSRKATCNLVFIGNSITEGVLHADKSKTAPPVLTASMVGKMLSRDIIFRNCGRSGATTVDFLPSEQRDFVRVEKAIKDIQEISYEPIIFSIMLGTNDLQLKKDITAEELPVGISHLVDIIQAHKKTGRGIQPPKVLILAPIEVRPSAPEGRTAVYAKFRCDIGRNLSLMFPQVYEQVAKEKGCYFLNAQEFAQPGPADGVHFDAESHIRLGRGVAQFIVSEIYPNV